MDHDERAAPGATMGQLPRGIGLANWAKWAALPVARLSQALLLSIGGDPDDWPEDRLQEAGQPLLERRRIALSRLRDGGLPLLERDGSAVMESIVSLAEFAAWARGLGWELPERFPGAVILDAGRRMVRTIVSEAGHHGDGYQSIEAYKAEWAAKRARQALGYFTVCEAAQTLADRHGLDPARFVRERMLPAIAAGALQAFDPADWGPLRGGACRDFSHCVKPALVDGLRDSARFVSRTGL